MKTPKQIYEYICKRFDKIFKDNNLCEFDKNGKCGHYRTDYRGRHPSQKCCCFLSYTGKKNGRCNYYSSKGCTTQNIVCKTYACDYVWQKFDKNEKLLHSYNRLKVIYYEFYNRCACVSDYRTSKLYKKGIDSVSRYNYFRSKTELLNWIKLVDDEKQS